MNGGYYYVINTCFLLQALRSHRDATTVIENTIRRSIDPDVEWWRSCVTDLLSTLHVAVDRDCAPEVMVATVQVVRRFINFCSQRRAGAAAGSTLTIPTETPLPGTPPTATTTSPTTTTVTTVPVMTLPVTPAAPVDEPPSTPVATASTSWETQDTTQPGTGLVNINVPQDLYAVLQNYLGKPHPQVQQVLQGHGIGTPRLRSPTHGPSSPRTSTPNLHDMSMTSLLEQFMPGEDSKESAS